MDSLTPDPKWKPLQPGQTIYDVCQRCGHFRLSHWNPLTGKMDRCRRCRGQEPEPTPIRPLGEPGYRPERFETHPGGSCTAFLETQMPERH